MGMWSRERSYVAHKNHVPDWASSNRFVQWTTTVHFVRYRLRSSPYRLRRVRPPCWITRTVAKGSSMLAIIAAVLVVLWLLGFLAFHVSSGFIHLLLILAVLSVIAHFFRGRTSPA